MKKKHEEFVIRLRLPVEGLDDALTETTANVLRQQFVDPEEWEEMREDIYQRFEALTYEPDESELTLEVCINVKTLKAWVELSPPEDENWRPRLFRKWDKQWAKEEKELELIHSGEMDD